MRSRPVINIPLRGRLGNQLFIYAFARNINLKYDVDIRLITHTLKQKGIDNRLVDFNIPNEIQFIDSYSPSWTQRLGFAFYSRFSDYRDAIALQKHQKRWRILYYLLGMYFQRDGFSKVMLPRKKRSFFCDGFFQSEKYFFENADAIRKEIVFPDSIKDSCIVWSDRIIACEESICLHIRLGDYVSHPVHGVATEQYYINALNAMMIKKPSAHCFVFSDNVDSVMHLFEKRDNVTFIPSELSDLQTMYLGSCCKHFIISNSSFSWWMQYLSTNEDKIVYAPSRWYAKPWPCDIYQKSWTLIEV